MAAGSFSASLLGDIIRKQEEMWKNSRVNNNFDQPIETARVILANQQVAWDPIMNNARKCIGQKVVWLKQSDSTIGDGATASCTIAGTEIESDSKTYAPNLILNREFKVLDDQCKDIFEVQDKIAYQMMWAKTLLLSAFNVKVIALLEANLMANVAPQSGTYNATTKATYYTSGYWNQDLIAELNLSAIMNKINNPIILNGTNLYNAYFNSQYNVRNDNQKDQVAKFNHFNMYWDPRNIDSTVGAKATYVIDTGVLGFFNQNEYNTLVPYWNEDDKNTFTWREDLPGLSYMDNGVMKNCAVDVRMQRRCAANGSNLAFGYYFDVIFRGGLVTAPLNVSTDKGILKFINGVDPG